MLRFDLNPTLCLLEAIEFLKFHKIKKKKLAYKLLKVCEVNAMYIGLCMCACRAKYRLDYMHQ